MSRQVKILMKKGKFGTQMPPAEALLVNLFRNTGPCNMGPNHMQEEGCTSKRVDLCKVREGLQACCHSFCRNRCPVGTRQVWAARHVILYIGRLGCRLLCLPTASAKLAKSALTTKVLAKAPLAAEGGFQIQVPISSAIKHNVHCDEEAPQAVTPSMQLLGELGRLPGSACMAHTRHKAE